MSDVSYIASSKGEESSVARRRTSKSEENNSDSEQSREFSDYEILRTERIKRNMVRMEALELMQSQGDLNKYVSPQPTTDTCN